MLMFPRQLCNTLSILDVTLSCLLSIALIMESLELDHPYDSAPSAQKICSRRGCQLNLACLLWKGKHAVRVANDNCRP
jgi:hypothetical protein